MKKIRSIGTFVVILSLYQYVGSINGYENLRKQKTEEKLHTELSSWENNGTEFEQGKKHFESPKGGKYDDFVRLIQDDGIKNYTDERNHVQGGHSRQRRSRNYDFDIYEVYDEKSHKYVNYDIIHDDWASLKTNSFNFETRNNSTYIKPVLKIYWSFKRETIPFGMPIVAISEVAYESVRNFKPHVEIINRFLTDEDIGWIIEKNIEESFESWATALNGSVEFQKLPYDEKLRRSPNFDKVILISFENRVHQEEHAGIVDYFNSHTTIAHASTNFLHYSNSHQFYIAPTITTQNIVTLIDHVAKQKKTLHLTNREAFEKRYDLKSYEDWYTSKGKQDITRLLERAKTGGVCFKCVTTHEIGHSLGLGHSDDRTSIMFSYQMRTDDNITETDAIAVRKLFEPVTERIDGLRGKCFL